MQMYPYEAMFLVDPVKHTEDAVATEKVVSALLERHGAKVHKFERWDERKLAYDIKGHKRGIYLLSLFEMPGGNLRALRDDCELAETILRQLILRLDTDIPTYLAQCAKYQEKTREEMEIRRAARREDEDREGEEALDDFASVQE
jgi:small subunit ribosomal protein S6